MGIVVSVNLAVPRDNPAKDVGRTGIDKRPVTGPVTLRPPGPKTIGLGSGLIGDQVFDIEHHGGDDQAVYAYAREDLDTWSVELHRDLANGVFGENLTTAGLDVNSARLGERWRIGDTVELEVRSPRIPCGTFQYWMGEAHWMKRFTAAAIPGAYLRIVTGGEIQAGDPVTVVSRPGHEVSVALMFRALTVEPQLLPLLLSAGDALEDETRAKIERRLGAPR